MQTQSRIRRLERRAGPIVPDLSIMPVDDLVAHILHNPDHTEHLTDEQIEGCIDWVVGAIMSHPDTKPSERGNILARLDRSPSFS